MSPRRPGRDHRGLVMPPGRGIPRSPDPRPPRPAPPAPDVEAPSAASLRRSLEVAGAELRSLVSRIRECEACGPSSEPRVFGSGYPQAPVFCVKARPGADDVRTAAAFATEAEALHRAFDGLGLPLGWVYGTCATKVDSPDAEPCADHLLEELEIVSPRALVVFGPVAWDAVAALDGRCGLVVPDEGVREEGVPLRSGLVALLTEDLPAGVTERDAKRRLWRDLQLLPGLLEG